MLLLPESFMRYTTAACLSAVVLALDGQTAASPLSNRGQNELQDTATIQVSARRRRRRGLARNIIIDVMLTIRLPKLPLRSPRCSRAGSSSYNARAFRDASGPARPDWRFRRHVYFKGADDLIYAA